MKEKTIKILKIEENKLPYEKEILNELRALQKEIEGLIQVYPLENGTLAIINEEGKINGMKPNRWIDRDIICGPFFICGDDEEDFKSLTEEEIASLKEEFNEIPKFTGQEKQLEPRIEVYGFDW